MNPQNKSSSTPGTMAGMTKLIWKVKEKMKYNIRGKQIMTHTSDIPD